MLLVQDILEVFLDLIKVDVLIVIQARADLILVFDDCVLVQDELLGLLAYTTRCVEARLFSCVSTFGYGHLILIFPEEG